ncbi:circadian clock protein KaiA [Cyanobium sp. PCC 7001]|uniref:circadian clock protein KaiA n=1 Tax=Cyanobium sp. PCC 7001 TaxID=180281 RepID=UPI0001804A2B|nr:circadian clock protein KaiA [Cyanobium sp. PCC 7001]EDY37609.1 circadian clock protein KaiA [Cyanobium sp. PCC 7001]
MPESVLTVASLVHDPALQAAVARWLAGGRYALVRVDPSDDPVAALERLREDFDALLIEEGSVDPSVFAGLNQRGLVLPAVVIGAVTGEVTVHEAEVRLPPDQLEQLPYSLDAALSRFLRRGVMNPADGEEAAEAGPASGDAAAGREAGEAGETGAPVPMPWRLDDRLRERLGLLGVFYKRDPSRFLRNLPLTEQNELRRSLERSYRDLLLNYFRNPSAANQALESFVNTAFFSDLSITTTVQIHMDLIDSFSDRLRLEGHKTDFLQDYRLALLDVMAHLCEMYRRSIPPDVPLIRFSAST